MARKRKLSGGALHRFTHEERVRAGKARSAGMTTKERSESARHAVTARWARYKALQAAKTPEKAKKGEAA